MEQGLSLLKNTVYTGMDNLCAYGAAWWKLVPAPHQDINQSAFFVELPVDRTASLALVIPGASNLRDYVLRNPICFSEYFQCRQCIG